MSKMHYFSIKFLKTFNFGVWSSVIWPNCGFSSCLWWNRSSKNSYDVITFTSPNVAKITSKYS